MTIWNSNIIFPTIKQKQRLIANCRICFVCDSSITRHFPTVVLWHSTSSASLFCLFLGPEAKQLQQLQQLQLLFSSVMDCNSGLELELVHVFSLCHFFLPFDHFQRECRSAAIVVRF